MERKISKLGSRLLILGISKHITNETRDKKPIVSTNCLRKTKWWMGSLCMRKCRKKVDMTKLRYDFCINFSLAAYPGAVIGQEFLVLLWIDF